VSLKSGKVQNSVRDVATANGILFVCDEPDGVVRMYALPGQTLPSGPLAAGTYLGASRTLGDEPTHLAIQGNVLYVLAGASIYWAPRGGQPAGVAHDLGDGRSRHRGARVGSARGRPCVGATERVEQRGHLRFPHGTRKHATILRAGNRKETRPHATVIAARRSSATPCR
jgi:hypothetical protein